MQRSCITSSSYCKLCGAPDSAPGWSREPSRRRYPADNSTVSSARALMLYWPLVRNLASGWCRHAAERKWETPSNSPRPGASKADADGPPMAVPSARKVVRLPGRGIPERCETPRLRFTAAYRYINPPGALFDGALSHTPSAQERSVHTVMLINIDGTNET